MRSKTHKDWRLFLAALLMWPGAVSNSYAIVSVTVDIKPYNDGFVMARADGMLTWTDIDGNAIDSIKLKTEIAGIDVRDGRVLAVSPDCRILSVERGGRSRQLCPSRIKGATVVGIACTESQTLILTEGGMIYGTADFDSFKVFDFNGTYSSYYDETRFSAISASDNFIYIAGTYHNGMPAVFTSAKGNIWSERNLSYTDGGDNLMLEHQPLG